VAALVFLAFLASDIWVARDARRLGARRGTLGGFLDMGPVGWFFACLFLWLVAFPCYLATRPKLVAAKAAREGYPPQSYPSYPPPSFPPNAQYCASCGTALQGFYCGRCGAPAPSGTGGA
jgi:hypothetical protein